MGDARAHAARTAPLVYSAIDLSEAGLELRVLRSCVVGSGILLRMPTAWSISVCCARPVRDGWRSTARRPCSTTVACTGGIYLGERAHVRVLAGLRAKVEADRICGLGHHWCGAGHPSRLPLFRMVSSKAGAGSAPEAVGGEWRHTNERW